MPHRDRASYSLVVSEKPIDNQVFEALGFVLQKMAMDHGLVPQQSFAKGSNCALEDIAFLN